MASETTHTRRACANCDDTSGRAGAGWGDDFICDPCLAELERLAIEAEEQAERRCPDGGRCHHRCGGTCFRIENAGPLSGVYPGDVWPESIRTAKR